MPTSWLKKTALTPLFLLIVITPLVSQAAFGISPPFLNAGHLTAGAKYIQTVYLVQDQPNQDLNIKATLNVPEAIRSWIHIDKGLEFVIPNGTRQFPVQVEVDVPKSVSTGQYSGNLTFVTVPARPGEQVSIALGANVAINLTVGDEIFEKFSVPFVKPLDVEEGWNLVRVDVKFNNEGNIPESFDRATFDLQDRYGGVSLAHLQKNSDFPETPPFTIKEYIVEFPIDLHLGLGQYWASVSFYKNDKLIASERTVFSVLPAGSLSSPVDKALNYLGANWPYAVAALVIALFFVARWFIKRRREGK